MFLAPHIQTAQFLSQYSNPVYAYIFDQETSDPNFYTSTLNSTGLLIFNQMLMRTKSHPYELYFLFSIKKRSLAWIHSSLPIWTNSFLWIDWKRFEWDWKGGFWSTSKILVYICHFWNNCESQLLVTVVQVHPLCFFSLLASGWTTFCWISTS